MRTIYRRLAPLSIVMAAAIAFFTSSCDNEEFLSDNGVQSNSFVQPRNSQDLENLVEGAYYAASGNGGWRCIFDVPVLVSAFASDEGWAPTEYYGIGDDGMMWHNWDFSFRQHSRIERAWASGYASIATANQVIEFIEENGAFPDRNGEAWTDRMLGEAYFIRAWNYSMLARLFGPPPNTNPDAPCVILRPNRPSGAFDNPTLATVQEVYDLMVEDLDKAISLLPEQFNPNRDPAPYADRANKFAAHFLASRVHFLLNNWSEAERHATAVIESGFFPLQDDVLEPWIHRSYNSKGPETVFQYVQYNSGQQRWKASIIHRYLGYTDGNGRPGRFNNGQRLALSNHFLETVGWDDPAQAQLDKRYNEFFIRHEGGEDPRPTLADLDEPRVWPNKWYRSEWTGWGTASMSSLPLFRSAEMYLNRAYIRFRNGDNAGAAADLNAVRERAWVKDTDGDGSEDRPYVDLSAGQITEEVIEAERMKEMVFEDDRIAYLQALGKQIPVADRTGVSPIAASNVHHPVPQTEADRNPNVD